VGIGGSVFGGDSADFMSEVIEDSVQGNVNILANNIRIGGNIVAGPYGDVNILANNLYVGGRIIEAGGRVNICVSCLYIQGPVSRAISFLRNLWK
jgi:hypothetical protein